MEQAALNELLVELIDSWENEVIEFKQANDDFHTDKIGIYFSALSNEANLCGRERAWLIFGINNKSRQVVGSDYRLESERLQGLKLQVTQGAEPSISFRNIHVLNHPNGRVVLFEIPVAPRGLPISWKGHYYARAGESLVPLGLTKLDEIRQQASAQDWSSKVVSEAQIEHLDERAVEVARESFAKKHANRFRYEEVMGWSLATFLDKARLTQDGGITRTTLILLGKQESAHLLLPHPAQMTWKLEGPERAYEHFGPPFLLNTSVLYQRIRNIQVRILPDDALLPVEVAKYDQRVVLEALHNCISHQDYTRNGRILVIERPDRLVFENEGTFFEGQPGDYISGEKTPRVYRNPFLVQAMVQLNMIDTMGYGIHEMHMGQARRYLPLPDYDLSSPGSVQMTVHGAVADPAYTRLLIQKTDLPLTDILALDRIQKRLPIDDVVASRLRKAGLIEGRKPNLHVSASVAGVTASKAKYIRTRAQDDMFYAKLLTDYLEQYGEASRADIDDLLFNKLSDALSEKQKFIKIHSLLTKLRRQGIIFNAGIVSAPRWKLKQTPEM